MKKNIKLYNIILPIWIIWIFPPLLFICIVLNSIVDYFVTYISMKKRGIKDAKAITKKIIFKVVTFGFLADFAGAIALIGITAISNDKVVEGIMMNPFKNALSLLAYIPALVIAGVVIYWLNYKISFKNIDIDDKHKKLVSLYLAIFTAPYTFLIPTEWLLNIIY